MASDERYIDCPKCGYSVFMNLNCQSQEWNGFCVNCQEDVFVKDNKIDKIKISYCPLCGKPIGGSKYNNEEIRCESCGYKFEVYVPDES